MVITPLVLILRLFNRTNVMAKSIFIDCKAETTDQS